MTTADADCANAYRLLLRAMLPRLAPFEPSSLRPWIRRTLGAVRCGPLSRALADMEAAGEIHRPPGQPIYYAGRGPREDGRDGGLTRPSDGCTLVANDTEIQMHIRTLRPTIDDELAQRVRLAAAQEDMTLREWVNDAVSWKLEAMEAGRAVIEEADFNPERPTPESERRLNASLSRRIAAMLGAAS
jgi:hypothetical protein